MDSKQPGGEKDVDELLCDSSDILSQKRDALSETMNMDSGIQIDGLEKMTEDMCEDEGNKNKAIKLLKKEVDAFFAVGSPLGVFLAFHNIRIGIEEGEDSQEKEGRYGSVMIQRLTGSEEGRIDHMLQVRCFTNLMQNLTTMYMVMHMHVLILDIYF
ncbi:hypothetical protein SO802_024851 [Lithocarpus litseifolius]|uniref:Uncharacterized protein n=1 Tax=Lithocarpus litseifolius TaxID=425828 RepID=A0AAW2CCE5_9ROSI